MLYKIALSYVKGVGITTATKLLAATEGNSKDLFLLSEKELCTIENRLGKILNKKAKAEALKAAEQELDFIYKNDINPIFFKDAAYPSRLRDCNGAPIILYSKGNANLNAMHSLSIVGTRQPTQHGIDTTKTLVREIAALFPDTLIVSGLAYGIDITAHKAALFHHLPTTAVLGHGLQMIYPAAHRSIAERITQEQGALLTQYTSNANVLQKNFVERNVIVAAMSDATLVVESKEKGGAMTTAHIAASYGRDVLAVPGNIHEDKSKGCNKLIKIQVAALIESAKDIGYALGWETARTPSQQQLLFDLSQQEQEITQLLQQKGKMNIDTLSNELDIPTNNLLPIITQLEFKDIILAYPGKFYSLKK